MKLPDGHNYQTYLLNGEYYQGYQSLSLNAECEQWFTNVKEERKKTDIIKLCNLFSIKLFHLFEISLMESKKSHVSYQLTILKIMQSNDMREFLLNINDDLKHDPQCLLLLFMFLSNKLIDNYLPSIITSHKDFIITTTISIK